jgi:hypothetical protein
VPSFLSCSVIFIFFPFRSYLFFIYVLLIFSPFCLSLLLGFLRFICPFVSSLLSVLSLTLCVLQQGTVSVHNLLACLLSLGCTRYMLLTFIPIVRQTNCLHSQYARQFAVSQLNILRD